MKLTYTGGNAFPTIDDHVELGMTLREYFASNAMKGILAGDEVSVEFAAMTIGIPVEAYNPLVHWQQYIAKRAVAMADALLTEIENTAYEAPEVPVGTDEPRPIQPVEGMLRPINEETGEVERFTNGEWVPQQVVTAKGGEGGTADKPAGRGEIYVGGVLYTSDHPDYEEMLKKVCNFPGSCK